MNTAIITDDAELSERLAGQARSALALGEFITPDTTERAVALLTAATVLIEREMGPDMAAAALLTLLEPTVADWHARGAARH